PCSKDYASAIGEPSASATGWWCSRSIARAPPSTASGATCWTSSAPSSSGSGKSGFIVGADLKEFERFAAEGRVGEAIERGHRVYKALSALRCPTAALIHGACLGGGLELALACRYRVASDSESTRLGLPEVLLGIHPG